MRARFFFWSLWAYAIFKIPEPRSQASTRWVSEEKSLEPRAWLFDVAFDFVKGCLERKSLYGLGCVWVEGGSIVTSNPALPFTWGIITACARLTNSNNNNKNTRRTAIVGALFSGTVCVQGSFDLWVWMKSLKNNHSNEVVVYHVFELLFVFFFSYLKVYGCFERSWRRCFLVLTLWNVGWKFSLTHMQKNTEKMNRWGGVG